jgi:ribosome-binding protein aMBF1 (putative translation factor)
MKISEMTHEQLGMLLYKTETKSRRAGKVYLHSIGAPSSSEDLDMAIKKAQSSKKAVEARRSIEAKQSTDGSYLDAKANEMVAAAIQQVIAEITSRGLNRTEFAQMCGWPDSLVSNYLNGRKEPGLRAICRMAAVLNCTLGIAPEKKEKT